MSDAIPRQPHPHGGLHAWFQDRLSIDTLWQALFIRKIPFGVNLLYTLGFASLALFLVQVFTGMLLALYYSPSPDHAYDSVEYLISQVPFGQVIRGIHRWGASAMVVVVVVHLLVTFGMGAYKYPREVTQCNACHPGASAGIGPAVRGQQLAERYLDDGSLATVIRQGTGDMRPFPPDQLTDQELADVVAYLRGL